jgi:hypothetical protein
MSISSSSFQPFDLSVLSTYYTSTASLNAATAAAVLQAKVNAATGQSASGGGVEQAPTDVTPPWLTSQALAQAANPTTPTEQQVFQNASAPLFNPNDPSLDRPDVTQDFKNLFALYQGLSQMNTLATYAAQNPAASSQSTLLNSEFQNYMQQFNSFVSGISSSNMTVIPGLEQSSDTSTASQPVALSSFIGNSIATNNQNPVPGLDYSGSFTINVTDTGTGTTYSVPIDLSQLGGDQSINAIASYIDQQLGANGNIQSTVAVNQNPDLSYSLQVFTASGETVSFQADPSSQQPAVYVAGTVGAADTAQNFLTKYQSLSSAQPTVAFSQVTSATQVVVAGNTSSTAIPTIGAVTQTINPITGQPSISVAPTTGPPTESAGVTASGVAKDSDGNIYVVGTTDGNLGGSVTSGTNDVYLQKYDPSGNLVWTRSLGASGSAQGYAVTVDANNNVIVTGQTSVPLTPDSMTSLSGSGNTFVTEYDQSGQEVFTYEPSTVSNNSGNAVTTDAQGNIFVAGSVNGVIDGTQTSGGGSDAYFTKLDSNGNVVYSQQFGGAGDQSATAIQVDNQGHVFVLYNNNGEAELSEYADAAGGSPLYTTDLGSVGSGSATGLALDGNSNVYVTGTTDSGNLNGPAQNSFTGTSDGFVQQIDAATGAINYTSYIGSSGATQATSVAVNGSSIYVTGSTTAALPGATQTSGQDGFLATLDASTGALTQATQFGNAFGESGQGVLVDPTGDSVLSQLGLPTGSAPGLTDPDGIVDLDSPSVQAQIGARAGQSLTIAVNGGLKKTVTLSQGETLQSLASSINSLLGTNGTARVVNNDDDLSQSLQITATNGSQITIGDGPQGFDLLPALGLQAETIYAPAPASTTSSSTPISPFLSDIEPTTPAASASSPSITQLGFTTGLNLSTTQSATDAQTIIQNAMIQVKKEYQLLTQGPTQATPAITGTVPTETTKEIAQFKAAELQLGIGNYASSSSSSSSGSNYSGITSILAAGYSGTTSSSTSYTGYTVASYSSSLANLLQPITSA